MMRVHTLGREQVVPRPLDEVFAFFERPENLERITPDWMRMQFLTPAPIPMHAGSAIDYVVRVHRVPLRWTTLITEYDPPHRFVDVQLRGPYAFWHHTHTFEKTDGGTIIRDAVRYALPFGPMGEVAHALFVRRDLNAIFAYRERAIEAKFVHGAAAPAQCAG